MKIWWDFFIMIINVKQLKFRYRNNSENTIKGITFSINEGEIFGFLGPSGSGKSTTQKILIGLLKGFEGSITVCGKDLNKWNENYYEKIGVGFEFPNHYEKLTAIENLKFFSTFYNKKNIDFYSLLEQVDLVNDCKTAVAKFSKGMKMRLNFVRAIMNDPCILFLDEPTSGLDPVNARKIKNMILQKKAEKKTVFLTTHNMNDAEKLCDRVAFIVNGELKIIDTPENLKLKESKNSVTVQYIKNNELLSKEFELDSIGKNNDFLYIIKNHKIKTIHSKESGLEEVFIKTTGESIQ